MPSPELAAAPVPQETPTEQPPADAPQNGSPADQPAGREESSAVVQESASVNGSAHDSISDGKQNAKAVLAASGVSVDPAESKPTPPDRPESPTSAANEEDGSSSGKKRSRSGSIIQSPPASTHPVQLRETPVDKILLDQYVNREFQYSALAAWRNPHQELLQQKREERDYYISVHRERQMNTSAIFGPGYEGFGNARTDIKSQHPQLLYPTNRKRPGGRKTRELRIPRREMKTQAEQIEDLVPVRLDIDWDKIKIRDTFTWNLHDRVTSPDLFAEKLVEDLGLPLESCTPLVRQISHSIQEQVTDYYPQLIIEEGPLDPHLPYNAYKNDDMRVLIKLNITIGQHTLVDQFEWEINNPLNSPEEFALQMTSDLSLSGEFTTAIAHSIREQTQLFTKSLYIVSHPFDGRPIDDPDLVSSFQPTPLNSPFRPYQSAKDFTPYLYELNEADIERTEVSISREQRRQKRSVNRRGGPALPDLKDRQRTIRTLVVSSVLPGAAASMDESRIFKRSGTGRGRRAAAGQRDGADESDDSDSDESSAASPAVSYLAQGTARTRGMRGAASAAQAAMRANLGRSATPETASLHHHETRVSARRRDYREESVDEDKLIVKLKISPLRFRQFLKDLKSRNRQSVPAQPSPYPNTPQMSTPTPQRSQSNSIAPQPRSATTPNKPQQRQVQQIGVIDAPHPLPPGAVGVSIHRFPLVIPAHANIQNSPPHQPG